MPASSPTRISFPGTTDVIAPCPRGQSLVCSSPSPLPPSHLWGEQAALGSAPCGNSCGHGRARQSSVVFTCPQNSCCCSHHPQRVPVFRSCDAGITRQNRSPFLCVRSTERQGRRGRGCECLRWAGSGVPGPVCGAVSQPLPKNCRSWKLSALLRYACPGFLFHYC